MLFQPLPYMVELLHCLKTGNVNTKQHRD